MNEKKAINLCLRYNDPIGFEFLVKKFKREAYFHAYSFTGNSDDAADICQESFSKAFNALPKLKHLNKFYPWFYQILKNTSLNFLKKKRTTRDKYFDILNGSETAYDSPEMTLEKEDKGKTIWKILYELKPEFREILIQKYVEGKSYRELSEILSIPRGTVMSRLYNARKSFKDLYTKEVKNAG